MISSANVVTLQQVTIDGYRSCRNTDFSLHPNLSALIGINGAGKTNLLSALRLLSFRTRRGFRSETDGNASLSETVITSWFLVNNLRIGYRIRLFLSTTSKNTDEIASAVEEWNFQNITKSKIWREIPDEYLLSKHREFRNIKNINSKVTKFALVLDTV